MGNRMGKLTHGMCYTSLYKRWDAMVQRTMNPDSISYYNYGARGIGICSEWLKFESFRDWALSNGYDELLTLDRINNDGHYTPDNCRWVVRSVNQANRRKKELFNIYPKSKGWCVQVRRPDKYHYVGYFHSIYEAVKARDNFIKEYDKQYA
jgi:hypothetical protein